jgi:hypothetical protein
MYDAQSTSDSNSFRFKLNIVLWIRCHIFTALLRYFTSLRSHIICICAPLCFQFSYLHECRHFFFVLTFFLPKLCLSKQDIIFLINLQLVLPAYILDLSVLAISMRPITLFSCRVCLPAFRTMPRKPSSPP